MTPFIIRREKVGEVMLLVRRVNDKGRRKKGAKKNDKMWVDSKGNTHIRRQATNDNWY